MKRWMIKILFFSLASLCCLARAATAEEVAILVTEEAAAYEKVAKEIEAQLGHSYKTYDMKDSFSQNDAIISQINAQKPALIIALGDKAAELASEKLNSTPILIGMVLELDKEPFKGAGIEGVGLQIPPQSVLTQLKLLVPNFKRIGVLSSGTEFASFRNSIKEIAQGLGVQAVDLTVSDKKDVANRVGQELSNLDALWLLPDPTILDNATFQGIVGKAQAAKKAIVVYSENFVRAGALFSVSPDYQATGQQLALLAKKMLAKENVKPEHPYLSKFHYPIGSYSVLNTRTAQQIGLNLSQQQLGFIDRIVGGE